MAVGRTDREIGEELFISVGTAGTRVGNILNSTNSANLVEATDCAAQLGLE